MSARQPRLWSLHFLCIVLILLFPEFGYSQAEDIAKYPGRPINFIITSPPGTGSDLAIRVLIKGAEKTLGQPITIVDNVHDIVDKFYVQDIVDRSSLIIARSRSKNITIKRQELFDLSHGIAGYIVSKLRVHDVVTIISVHDVLNVVR